MESEVCHLIHDLNLEYHSTLSAGAKDDAQKESFGESRYSGKLAPSKSQVRRQIEDLDLNDDSNGASIMEKQHPSGYVIVDDCHINREGEVVTAKDAHYEEYARKKRKLTSEEILEILTEYEEDWDRKRAYENPAYPTPLPIIVRDKAGEILRIEDSGECQEIIKSMENDIKEEDLVAHTKKLY